MALSLPDLDPQECLDYSVDFSDLMAAGTSIINASVEIESATPDASPLPNLQYTSPSIFLTNTQAQPSPTPSPLYNDTVVFWLEGANGVVNTKYVYVVRAFDDNVPQRCYTRRVTIKVKTK